MGEKLVLLSELTSDSDEAKRAVLALERGDIDGIHITAGEWLVQPASFRAWWNETGHSYNDMDENTGTRTGLCNVCAGTHGKDV